MNPANANVRNKIQNIVVLTSGGDAPGMNAAIRAVVRASASQGWHVFGARDGFAGLISGDIQSLTPRDVGGILQLGGTYLGTARCPEFKTQEGREKARDNLNKMKIDAIVVIGGNGSQTGAYALAQMGIPVVGIASTIDNDLLGTEITIGVDTALNIALESIDRLKVTASSHRRAFVLEVMGRDCGYLALMAGVAGGAEVVLIPEVESDPQQVARDIQKAYQRGKRHALIVVAEGASYDAKKLQQFFQDKNENIGFDLRVSILGHIQRGGAPSYFDRMLASRFGVAAVEALAQGNLGVLVGINQGQITTTSLASVVGKIKKPDLSLLEMVKTLAQ